MICRSRKSASARKASTSENIEPNMPEHDLEPPKFARKALEKLLYDWNTVKAMIMTGHKDTTSKVISKIMRSTPYLETNNHVIF